MENREKILQRLDKAMVFSFCPLIYFIPISIALTESFAALVLFLFLLKKSFVLRFLLKDFVRAGGRPSVSVFSSFFLKAFRPVDSILNRPIAFYIFVSFMSFLVSQYHYLSFRGFSFKLLEGVFLYFSFVEVFKSKKDIKIFLSVLFISAFLICINGVFQYITGKGFIHGYLKEAGRVLSSFRSPNDFAGYLVIVVFILLSISLAWIPSKSGLSPSSLGSSPTDRYLFSSKKVRLFFWGVLILAIFCLGVTYSRSAWLGFVFGLLLLTKNDIKGRWLFLFILVVFVIFFLPKFMSEREPPLDMESLFVMDGRDDYWKEAWHIIRDYPLLGVGINTYSVVGQRYKINWGGYPHNCYLQMTAEIGFIGLASFFWIILSLFCKILKRFSEGREASLNIFILGVLAGILAFLVQSFFDTNLYSVQLVNFFWVILGLAVAAHKINQT